MDHHDKALEAYKIIYDIFENTKIKNYVGQDFIYYKMLKQETKDFQLLVKNKKDKQMPVLKYLYKETIFFRNRIAHNISSIQPEIPSVNHLKNKNMFYDNYFTRYMILTYFDLVFMDSYKKFKKNIAHIEL